MPDSSILELNRRHGAVFGATGKHRVVRPAGAENSPGIPDEVPEEIDEMDSILYQ